MGGKMHGEVKRVDGKRVASPEYRAWQAMRNRCKNANCQDVARYAGRGISIDPVWDTFEQFILDMGRRPSDGHTLDRIDNDLGYGPGNCRWATREEQSRNRGTYNKHSKDIADEVRELYATGCYTQVEIARMFSGMCQVDVSQIVRNTRWK